MSYALRTLLIGSHQRRLQPKLLALNRSKTQVMVAIASSPIAWWACLLLWSPATVLCSSLTSFADSAVVYTATDGTQLNINQCMSATFAFPTDVTRTYIDVNLYNTDGMVALQSGPSVFRECVRTNPVLALSDSGGLTQAVIDYAASQLNSGKTFEDAGVHDMCRHHAQRCFMFYDADPNGDSSSPVVGGTATYNLAVTYQGTTYQYPVHMKHCGQVGYHNWVGGTTAASMPATIQTTVVCSAQPTDRRSIPPRCAD
eukprot:4094394-Prymnesium_polylepis.1